MESGEFDEELAKALAMSLENTIHPPSGLEPVERSNEVSSNIVDNYDGSNHSSN
jgi:hypothetical protein